MWTLPSSIMQLWVNVPHESSVLKSDPMDKPQIKELSLSRQD